MSTLQNAASNYSADWFRLMALTTPGEQRWDMLCEIASEGAGFAAHVGIPKQDIVDHLYDLANNHTGVIGDHDQSEVEQIISDAFMHPRNVPIPRFFNEETWKPPTGNGFFDQEPEYLKEPPASNGRDTRLEPPPIDWTVPPTNGPAPTPPVTVKILSSAEFVAGFVPPEYLVVGLLQRRFFYSLTALTGHGKTAIMLILAAVVALGKPFAGKETKKTRVLYLAAENAEDVRMRWIALAEQMVFDISNIEVYFVPGRFTLSQATESLRAEAKKRGGEFGLVMVDTGPTFFEGKEENENKQAGDHARMLRGLIEIIPGGPTVVAAGHPSKYAAADQILPRGGGAFLNEVDGNLTCWKTDSTVELGTQGKFRGPDFAPMNFQIRTVTSEKLKDRDGRYMPTVIAEHISDEAKDNIAAAARTAEDQALKYIADNPAFTQATLAMAMKWTLYSGEPNKSRAARVVRTLVTDKLIKPTRAGRYTITPQGKKVLNGDDEADEEPGKKTRKGEDDELPLTPRKSTPAEKTKPKREDWYRDLTPEERAEIGRRISEANQGSDSSG